MPWSNQGGGGPWGSGGKGPWGSGPQSPGPTPPDLEEILRRGQDKLRRVLPGGNLGGAVLLSLSLVRLRSGDFPASSGLNRTSWALFCASASKCAWCNPV